MDLDQKSVQDESYSYFHPKHGDSIKRLTFYDSHQNEIDGTSCKTMRTLTLHLVIFDDIKIAI
jgi:hypothetical protein